MTSPPRSATHGSPDGAPGQVIDALRSRYAAGAWRSEIFAEMVEIDLVGGAPGPVLLDVGCGGGFDGSAELQRRLAGRARRMIGVEPDAEARVGEYFDEVHRAVLEDAPIATASVDVAYAVMVLEHVAEPERFLAKVADALVDGGVFWAFTVDVRHWSAWASLLMDRLGVKDRYLDRLHGVRGQDRYENFAVHYRLNSPRAFREHAGGRFDVEAVNLSRVGAEDYNLPAPLRPLNHGLDHLLGAVGAPGSNLVFRAVRRAR